MGWGGGEVPSDAGPYIYIYRIEICCANNAGHILAEQPEGNIWKNMFCYNYDNLKYWWNAPAGG